MDAILIIYAEPALGVAIIKALLNGLLGTFLTIALWEASKWAHHAWNAPKRRIAQRLKTFVRGG